MRSGCSTYHEVAAPISEERRRDTEIEDPPNPNGPRNPHVERIVPSSERESLSAGKSLCRCIRATLILSITNRNCGLSGNRSGRVTPGYGPRPWGPCRRRRYRPVSRLGAKSLLRLEIGNGDLLKVSHFAPFCATRRSGPRWANSRSGPTGQSNPIVERDKPT